ncbi:MAG: aminoacyl-tRNA hydrolase [Eubacteriales bacterium]
MKAIIGLGNPGEKYLLTRHNIGFQVIDFLAGKNQVKFKYNHKALIGSFYSNHEKILLVKPQTYMNLSGESVLQIVNYFGLSLEELFVIYDDIDLDLGKIRIREKGSAGTHNGMKSMIFQLESEEIPRMRIGIGKPEDMPLTNYVLHNFKDEELPIIREMVTKAEEVISCFVLQGINSTMNKYNN